MLYRRLCVVFISSFVTVISHILQPLFLANELNGADTQWCPWWSSDPHHARQVPSWSLCRINIYRISPHYIHILHSRTYSVPPPTLEWVRVTFSCMLCVMNKWLNLSLSSKKRQWRWFCKEQAFGLLWPSQSEMHFYRYDLWTSISCQNFSASDLWSKRSRYVSGRYLNIKSVVCDVACSFLYPCSCGITVILLTFWNIAYKSDV